jgi:iron-sulfur cluster repair protein YtfE (RIC family)
MELKLSLLTKLEAEHRKAEKLLKKLEKAETAAAQQPLVDQLLAAMAEHMRVEETQVYPVLEEVDGEMAEEAEIEHDLARQGLQTLAGMIGKPGFGAAVAMVQAGIEHHVEEEEGEVFPKLRKAVGGTTRKASPMKRSAAKKAAPTKAAATKGPAKKASTATKKATTKKAAAKR